MRFGVEFEVDNLEIPKDKNKIFVSWIKHMMENYDETLYKRMYKEGAVEKTFTFSIYLGKGAKFQRESIIIESKQIKMFFSCYELEDGILFYNLLNRFKYQEYQYKNISIKPIRVWMEKDSVFKEDNIMFRIMSPIIVREHKHSDNSDYYHDLSSLEGQKIFLENIKSRLAKQFGEEISYDLENINVQILKNKMVTVRHHGINIPSNLGILSIQAKPYILEFLYLSGTLSSLNASGYGYVVIQHP